MKNDPWKLVAVLAVLTTLVLSGCGPKATPTAPPTDTAPPMTREASPEPSPKPAEPAASAAPPVFLPALPPGSIIDDFESGDFDDRWWPYTGEGTTSFACTRDQPGHASAHAMWLTFEVGVDSYAGCGIDVDPGQWGEAGGLSFFWRADQPGLTVIVALGMEDPTQTHPGAEGATPFEVLLQTHGEEWETVTLTWDAFTKGEWVGESGVDVLDPARVVALYFEVVEAQSGSVWFDDLQLQTASGAAALSVVPPTSPPEPSAAPTGTLPESDHAAPATPKSTPAGIVYYVAVNEPGASDANNGLYPTYQGGQDGPWLSIQHAASTMTAGDTTYVRAGTYDESGIVFAHSGAPGAPITLASYPSEQVVIDGSQASESLPGIGIVEGRSHYVIQGLTIRNMPWSGIATDDSTTEPYRDITIRDCTLHDNGWSGLDLAVVDGFVVENVQAYANAYYGMNIIGSQDGALSAANGTVRNSSFYNHTGDEGHGLAINQGHHITVSDSIAYHNTIHGFDVSDWPKYGQLSHHITLERNFSYDNGVAGFAINSDSHHVIYRNNVAWRNGADWAGHGASSGFLCYRGCWHVEWYNNVSLENSDAGFWVEEGLGTYGTPEDNLLIFKNNIAYDNDPRGWAAALVIEGKDTWQVVAEHNNWSVPPGFELAVINQGIEYTPAQINGGAFQTGNISVDPQFVDATAPDVHLQPGSPCIDAGVDIGLPYLGPAPDMGAFEFAPPRAYLPLVLG